MSVRFAPSQGVQVQIASWKVWSHGIGVLSVVHCVPSAFPIALVQRGPQACEQLWLEPPQFT